MDNTPIVSSKCYMMVYGKTLILWTSIQWTLDMTNKHCFTKQCLCSLCKLEFN